MKQTTKQTATHTAKKKKRGGYPPSLQHTKILCTLGPATATQQRIRQLMLAGADAIRLNFSHSSHETHKSLFDMTREVAAELGRHVAIIQDLQGPKIRVGALPHGPVLLRPSSQVILTTGALKPRDERIPVGYKNFARDIQPGNIVLIDDGLLMLRVDSVKGEDVTCTVIDGGLLKEKKGINLPGANISEPALTAKDLKDLKFGLDLGVDYVALSFVRSAQDIVNLKRVISMRGKDTPVIAKIEKMEAIQELDGIIHAADAIMVARGDLGVELPSHEVPLLQKRIVKRCNQLGKPVITATQMLESMVNNPRPTRAESSDVANAVFDGTDVVMLSAETSVGAYPVQAVMMMNDIIRTTESAIPFDHVLEELKGTRSDTERSEFAVASAACVLASQVRVSAILCLTYSGTTAKVMSRQRPEVPIIAMAQDEALCRRLAVYRGIYSITIPQFSTTEEAVALMGKTAIEAGVVESGDLVIITTGFPLDEKASTNMLLVDRV